MSANAFHEKAGRSLLYLLRFERVDNLGAYSISSETGLLIPSGFANYPMSLVRFSELTLARGFPV